MISRNEDLKNLVLAAWVVQEENHKIFTKQGEGKVRVRVRVRVRISYRVRVRVELRVRAELRVRVELSVRVEH